MKRIGRVGQCLVGTWDADGWGVVVDGGSGLGWGLPAMPTQTMATGGVAMVVGGSGVVFFDCWVSELWGSLVLC